MEHDLQVTDKIIIPGDEISWRFSRSGGPGGQNVNKVESRVTILFNPDESVAFNDSEKAQIRKKLAGLLDSQGNVFLDVSQERSQLRNRMIARDRLVQRLREALRPVKKRKRTRIPVVVNERRLEKKRKTARKKSQRQRGRRLMDGY